MEKIIKKFKSFTVIDYCMLLILGIQFVFVIYSDLVCVPINMDNDASKTFVRAMEVWKQKTIYLPNWSQMTTLETGNPTILAVFFYGLFKDIYLAYTSANIVMLLLFLCVFYCLFKRLNVNTTGAMFGMVLLMTPLSFGQLLYYNMMFYAVGAYSFRMIIPLLMILLLTEDYENLKLWQWILTLLLTCTMVFLCAISTGVYVFITAIFPTIIVYIWMDVLKREHIWSNLFCKSNVSCFAVLITFIAGLGIYYSQSLMASGMDKDLISIYDFSTSLGYILPGFMEMFGALPYNGGSIMSLSGVMYMLRMVLAVIAFGVLVKYGISCLKNMFQNQNEINDNKAEKLITSMLFMIAFVAVIICVATGTGNQVRYLLLTMVPVLVFLGCEISNLIQYNKFGRLQKIVFSIAMVVAVVLVVILSDKAVIKGEGYPPQKSDNEKLMQVRELIDTMPEKQIYFLNDAASAENMRLFDYGSDRVYTSYMLTADEWNGTGVVVHDYYLNITDAASMDENNLMIVNENLASYDQMPVYLQNIYTEVDSYQNFHIYKSDKNRLDGVIGYSHNEVSKDYCYSDGYVIYQGEIDDIGNLQAVGNDDYVVASPLLGDASGEVCVTMNYESALSGELGRLEVWDGYSHELIAEQTINGAEGSVSIPGISLDGRNLVVKVWINKDCEIGISDFIYQR